MQAQSKIHVAILCGGQSAEHEVSITSAKNILQALDATKYQAYVIVISKKGEWILLDSAEILLNNPNMQNLPQPLPGSPVVIRFDNSHPLFNLTANIPLAIDVVFPVLHGAHGEDGTMQGLLEILNLPYVGPGTLSSAVSMDKEVSKKLLQAANIPVVKWLTVTKENIHQINFLQVSEQLGLPFFVKPANTGSSVGVSKVRNQLEYDQAINLALKYDYKILFEEFMPGREIECAVLGNEVAEASLPGEIICHHEFYSYEAKYLDPNGADIVVPADLPDTTREQIRELAKKAFLALSCEGMARVDFFLSPDGRIIVNEANTIPGFTQISMYPKMWTATGLSYTALISRLLDLAILRFQRNRILVAKKSEMESVV